jgi:hypothetical protein
MEGTGLEIRAMVSELAEPAMVYSARWWKRIGVGFAWL